MKNHIRLVNTKQNLPCVLLFSVTTTFKTIDIKKSWILLRCNTTITTISFSSTMFLRTTPSMRPNNMQKKSEFKMKRLLLWRIRKGNMQHIIWGMQLITIVRVMIFWWLWMAMMNWWVDMCSSWLVYSIKTRNNKIGLFIPTIWLAYMSWVPPTRFHPFIRQSHRNIENSRCIWWVRWDPSTLNCSEIFMIQITSTVMEHILTPCMMTQCNTQCFRWQGTMFIIFPKFVTFTTS